MAKDTYYYSNVSQDVKNNGEHFEKPPTIGIRHFQVFLYCALGFMGFGFRVCLSVGIVAMTDPSVSSNPDIPTYPRWKDKNVILSAFFWGYLLPQVFAAHVAKKYGAKWFLISTMVVQSILSFLTPLTAAHFGEKGLIMSRVLQGLCQGFIFPSCTHFLSVWVPPQERSRLGSSVFTAGKLGTVFSILVTGFLAASRYGWPMAFYFFGVLGLIWCIVMAVFGFNSPREHPRISQAERKYIEEGLGFNENNAHHKTPWSNIFKSRPVWALLAAQTSNNFCFWMLLTQIPTYMNYVMHFDIKHNSFWSSMPYLTFWIFGFVFGLISDWIVNKGWASLGTARKIFNSIGLMGPAASLIALGFTRSDQSAQAVAFLIAAVGINSSAFSGFAINHADLSPNHAGTLMGLLNGVSQLSAVFAPLVVQLLVTDLTDPLEWRKVFLLAAGISTIGAIIFNIFGSGKVQPWNSDDEDEEQYQTKKNNEDVE